MTMFIQKSGNATSQHFPEQTALLTVSIVTKKLYTFKILDGPIPVPKILHQWKTNATPVKVKW